MTKTGETRTTSQWTANKLAETRGHAKGELTERAKVEKRAQPAKERPISMQKPEETLKKR